MNWELIFITIVVGSWLGVGWWGSVDSLSRVCWRSFAGPGGTSGVGWGFSFWGFCCGSPLGVLMVCQGSDGVLFLGSPLGVSIKGLH